MNNGHSDPTASIADLERRRAERKAANGQLRTEQYARDLLALDALEEELGDGRVAPLELSFFTPGLPTFVVVRAPDEVSYRRFRDMVRNSKGTAHGKAADMLADVCVAYPDADTYKKLRDAYPGVHDSVAVQAIRLTEGKAAEEGKS